MKRHLNLDDRLNLYFAAPGRERWEFRRRSFWGGLPFGTHSNYPPTPAF